MLKPARALFHSRLIREFDCSGVICIKLERPPPFGGVRGLGVPLIRDDSRESVLPAGELPIGWCTRRHDTEGGTCLSAGGACGKARIDDTRGRSVSRDVFGLCVALRARASEPGNCIGPSMGGRGGRGGKGGRGGRGGNTVRFCSRMGCAGS